MSLNTQTDTTVRTFNTSKQILKKACLKFLSLNSKIVSNKKLRFLILKNKVLFLKMKSAKKKQCLLTNRGHATYKRYGLSRIILRDLLNLGLIPGFKKI